MSTWNDTEAPLAYLITFRTYGTWLPGDERGSIDRYHNRYRGLRYGPDARLEIESAERLKGPPVFEPADE